MHYSTEMACKETVAIPGSERFAACACNRRIGASSHSFGSQGGGPCRRLGYLSEVAIVVRRKREFELSISLHNRTCSRIRDANVAVDPTAKATSCCGQGKTLSSTRDGLRDTIEDCSVPKTVPKSSEIAGLIGNARDPLGAELWCGTRRKKGVGGARLWEG